MRTLAILAVLATPAAAEPAQVQLDFGLAVIGLGYEQPVGDHVSVMIEGQTSSTYFLPWFSAGDSMIGWGGEVRATWFSRLHDTGVYITPFVRVDRMTANDSAGFGFSAGGVVGWAFRLTQRLDLRLGVGAQYMRYRLPAADVNTPFFTLDAVLGYRL